MRLLAVFAVACLACLALAASMDTGGSASMGMGSQSLGGSEGQSADLGPDGEADGQFDGITEYKMSDFAAGTFSDEEAANYQGQQQEMGEESGGVGGGTPPDEDDATTPLIPKTAEEEEDSPTSGPKVETSWSKGGLHSGQVVNGMIVTVKSADGKYCSGGDPKDWPTRKAKGLEKRIAKCSGDKVDKSERFLVVGIAGEGQVALTAEANDKGAPISSQIPEASKMYAYDAELPAVGTSAYRTVIFKNVVSKKFCTLGDVGMTCNEGQEKFADRFEIRCIKNCENPATGKPWKPYKKRPW